MSASLTNVALWRRVLLIGITSLIALLAVSFSTPQDAHAFRDPTVVLPSHTGWVYVKAPPARVCPAIYPVPAYCTAPQPVAAWRWTGSVWTGASFGGGEQVYAYPYSGAWHWAWTQRTGWLAIETSKLSTGYSCTGPRCPVF